MSDNRDYYISRSDEERERARAASNPQAAAAHLGLADRYAILADVQPYMRIVHNCDVSKGPHFGPFAHTKCFGQRPMQRT